ncbi:MAG: hypothetical protein HF314_18635 [Ignavibacteria bacterium]|jgi:hypothetical protein|nr:hypothetical protein [Ignavibacteria bacterium]MCU7505106.1 hypothetical protein [Ignavibacteria bacterium]MCU7518062.1 hypothetical protein [Ignavibacteria bacterium]
MKVRWVKLFILAFLAFNSSVFSQSALNVKDSLGNSLLFIRSDGNIGLGSMNPLVKLQVMGDVRSSVLSGTGARLLFADDRGTIFARGTLPKPGWSLSGNKGINSDSNFIGTLDEKALIFKTGGSRPANERMRILPEGNIAVNGTSFRAGDLFSAYGTGYPNAINQTEGLSDYPVNGYSTGNFSGIYGENSGPGEGVLGVNTSSGSGVFGQNTASGFGLRGISFNGFGAAGFSRGIAAAGLLGVSQDPMGTGLLAIGNGLSGGLFLKEGAGLSSIGKFTGLFAFASDSAAGTGIIGTGNNLNYASALQMGSGLSGNGRYFGIAGFAHSDTSAREKWGGYFEASGAPDAYAFLGGRLGKTDFGILTLGTNAIMVKDGAGQNRVMFNTASPEVLLEDYGTGQLERGFAHVSLDSLFSGAIVINDVNPMKVFVQVEGDCNGVFVANKTKEGFDVKELRNGRSRAAFSWHVVATRADLTGPEGSIMTDYSTLRFPAGSRRPASTVIETSRVNLGSEKITEKSKKQPSEYKKPTVKKKKR